MNITPAEYERICDADDHVLRTRAELRELIEAEGTEVIFTPEFRKLYSRLATARIRAVLYQIRSRKD